MYGITRPTIHIVPPKIIFVCILMIIDFFFNRWGDVISKNEGLSPFYNQGLSPFYVNLFFNQGLSLIKKHKEKIYK